MQEFLLLLSKFKAKGVIKLHIYIDESGSMTNDTSHIKRRFFVIALILVENPEKLKKVYKRFVNKYFKQLKTIDKKHRVFDGDRFVELKGSAFSPEMKRNFVDYFCRNNHFKILFIQLDNAKASKNLYKNKARAFNYVLKLSLEYLHGKGNLPERTWTLNIDERNIKTEAKDQLQDFLYTELSTGKNIVDEIYVHYYISSNNKIIQVADVFANIYYSNFLSKGSYTNELNYMRKNGYLIDIFKFPPGR